MCPFWKTRTPRGAVLLDGSAEPAHPALAMSARGAGRGGRGRRGRRDEGGPAGGTGGRSGPAAGHGAASSACDAADERFFSDTDSSEGDGHLGLGAEVRAWDSDFGAPRPQHILTHPTIPICPPQDSVSDSASSSGDCGSPCDTGGSSGEALSEGDSEVEGPRTRSRTAEGHDPMSLEIDDVVRVLTIHGHPLSIVVDVTTGAADDDAALESGRQIDVQLFDKDRTLVRLLERAEVKRPMEYALEKEINDAHSTDFTSDHLPRTTPPCDGTHVRCGRPNAP